MSAPEVLSVLSGVSRIPNSQVGPESFYISQDGPFQQWIASDGRSLEPGIDPDTLAVTWRAQLPSATYWLDDETGVIFDIVKGMPTTTTKTCDIRHPDHPRDGNGRATSVFTEQGTFIEGHNCTADESSGTCHFRLQYHPDWTPNTIDHVVDDDDGQILTVTESCTSPTRPAFTSLPDPNCGTCFNGDLMRQQIAYWGVSIDQTVATSRVWASVAPSQQDWVHPLADHDSTINCGGTCLNNGASCQFDWDCPGSTCGNPGSCFDPYFTHNIYVSSSLSSKVDVWMHEYGHYIGGLTETTTTCVIPAAMKGRPYMRHGPTFLAS